MESLYEQQPHSNCCCRPQQRVPPLVLRKRRRQIDTVVKSRIRRSYVQHIITTTVSTTTSNATLLGWTFYYCHIIQLLFHCYVLCRWTCHDNHKYSSNHNHHNNVVSAFEMRPLPSTITRTNFVQRYSDVLATFETTTSSRTNRQKVTELRISSATTTNSHRKIWSERFYSLGFTEANYYYNTPWKYDTNRRWLQQPPDTSIGSTTTLSATTSSTARSIPPPSPTTTSQRPVPSSSSLSSSSILPNRPRLMSQPPPQQRRLSTTSSSSSSTKRRRRQKMKPMPILGYNARTILAYYDARPLEVGWRLNSLGFPLLGT